MTTRPFTPRLPHAFVVGAILDQKFQLSNFGKFMVRKLTVQGSVTIDKWNFFAKIIATA
jgi:hypothetical protein